MESLLEKYLPFTTQLMEELKQVKEDNELLKLKLSSMDKTK